MTCSTTNKTNIYFQNVRSVIKLESISTRKGKNNEISNSSNWGFRDGIDKHLKKPKQ